jgi:diguanylate cyclase (GGDEF)-like protein
MDSPPPLLDDTRAATYRLATLRREIAAAEATLRALQAEILQANSDRGRLASHDARAENLRLTAENRLAAQDAVSAHAALQVALAASRTDTLTGLHNRQVLWERLAHDLALARRLGHGLAVYFLDIDGLKDVNDRFGHAAGDLLLQHAAQVLRATVRASDTVCRLGGDEFVIVAAANQRDDAEQIVAKIAQALALTCLIAGHPMSVAASIGYSLFPDDGDAPGVLVHKADEAMYRLKRAQARQR